MAENEKTGQRAGADGAPTGARIADHPPVAGSDAPADRAAHGDTPATGTPADTDTDTHGGAQAEPAEVTADPAAATPPDAAAETPADTAVATNGDALPEGGVTPGSGSERRAARRTDGSDPVEPAIAQRNSLPMRKASTMPDLRRLEDTKTDDATDDAGTVGAAVRNDGDDGIQDSRQASLSGTSAPDSSAPDTSALSVRPSEEDVSRRAAERDDAFTGKPVMARVFQVLVAVFFPVMLLAAAIRAVTSPLFLWVEYHRPGFPADAYGFSTEDRMTYASYTVDYILNWASPRYLGDLVNADGEQLFLDSEVGHMLDVKSVLVLSFAVALAMLVFTLVACRYLTRNYHGGVRRALFSGALATLILMAVLTVTAVVGWQTFFTRVHTLFFADGTWTFRLDDTLIRLFPAQFWMDAAITVAALVLIVTVLTLILTWPTRARREKSRLAGEAARQRRLNSLNA